MERWRVAGNGASSALSEIESCLVMPSLPFIAFSASSFPHLTEPDLLISVSRESMYTDSRNMLLAPQLSIKEGREADQAPGKGARERERL